MNSSLIVSAFLVAALSACSSDTDASGVPKVDIHGTIVATTDAKAIAAAKKWGLPIPSRRMIDVKGKQIPLQEFLLTYCQGKYQNETCVRASKISIIDASNGPQKDLPKGL